MSASKLGVAGAALAVGLSAAWWGFGRLTLAQESAVQLPQQEQAVEVLTRGPVHEAFAEPVTLERNDPLMIQTAPPEPVEELPPEQVPQGENVQWISGYWAWDDEREDFIWVSGVWRDIPPGQRWVPGYWSDSGRGWYWTSGFWISEEVAEVEYLPEPPESLEAGPQLEAPSADHVWVPGVWRYHETRYVWQPGFWTVVRPGWVWVPARYAWCPTGYVFVDGYWDYPLVRRGVLFAPVYYYEPVFVQPSYYYTPTVVIQAELLTTHLFARPSYCHYYFGDYYAPRYRDFGIVPWFSLQVGHVSYDPLFSYYSWYHSRRDPGWHRHIRRRYDFFAANERYRPAHTFRELRRQRFADVRGGDVNIQNIVSQQNNLAVTLNQYVQDVEQDARVGGRREAMRFKRMPEEQRRDFVERARHIRRFAERRGEFETATLDPATPGSPEQEASRTLPIEQLTEQADRRGRARRSAEGRFDRRGRAVADDDAEQVDPTRRRLKARKDAAEVAEATPEEALPAGRDARQAITRDERRGRFRDRAEPPEATPDAEATAEDVGRETRDPFDVRRRGRVDEIPGRTEREATDAVTREEQRARFRDRADVRDRITGPGVDRPGQELTPRARDPLRLGRPTGPDAGERLGDLETAETPTRNQQQSRFREQQGRGRIFEPGAGRTRENFAPRTRDPLQPDPRVRGGDADRRGDALDVPSDIRQDVRRSLDLPQRVEDPARGKPLLPREQPEASLRTGRGQDGRGAAMSDAIQAAPRFRTPVDVGEPRLQPDPSARQFERGRGQFERPARPELGVPARTPGPVERRPELRNRFEARRPQPSQDAAPGAEAMERLRGRSGAESPQSQRWRGAEGPQQQLRSTAPSVDALRSRAMPRFSADRQSEARGQGRGGFRGFERPDGDSGRDALQRMGRGAGRGGFAPQEAQSPRAIAPGLGRGGGDEGRGRGRPDRRSDREDDDDD